jgi:hypothetical protein
MIERCIADNKKLAGLLRFLIPGGPSFAEAVPGRRSQEANLSGGSQYSARNAGFVGQLKPSLLEVFPDLFEPC